MKGFWRKGAMTMPAWAVTQTSAARSAPTTRMRARSTDRRGSMGHALMEKRTGLVVGSMLTQLTGHGRAGSGACAACGLSRWLVPADHTRSRLPEGSAERHGL